MALIPYPTMESLSPEVCAQIEHFRQEHNRPTLVRLMLAWYPPALHAIDQTYHPIVEGGRLGRRLKELLFVASSHQRECFY